MVMPLLFFELGQKFSFPVKAVKENNIGGRSWQCSGPPWCHCSWPAEFSNILGLWGCRHH